MSTWERFLTSDATMAAIAADTTDIVARAEQIHKTSAVVTAGLGRLLTAASLMGCLMKGEKDSLTLRIKGDGPISQMIAVSDSDGNVRGYAAQPVVELPLNPQGKLDVGRAVGKGLLSVVRDTGDREPYVGCTPLVTGEIAEDITRYYAESEQIPTVCALGVLVNPDLTVRAAGGLLIQLLPGCPSAQIDRLEQSIRSLPPITALLQEGCSPREIAHRALKGFSLDSLASGQAAYRCTCSRERVEKALIALPPEEREALPDEQGMTQVRCHFCDAVYDFTVQQLRELSTGTHSAK